MTTHLREEAAAIKPSYTAVIGPRLWTAARCHRLLRPIQSRIELLKRVSSFKSCTDPSENDGSTRGHLKTVQKLLIEVGDHQRSAASDDEWKPSLKRRRRTYSGKQKALASTKGKVTDLQQCHKAGLRTAFPVEGEINKTCISTPLLRRPDTADHICDTERLHRSLRKKKSKARMSQNPPSHSVSDNTGKDPASVDAVDRLKQTTGSARFSLYLGLLNAFRVLLETTSPTDGTTLQTNRSLMSMALRSVPRQVHEEERLARLKSLNYGIIPSPDLPDVASKMYSELEQYGYSGGDWQHLQTVVRADGLGRICIAIDDDHLKASFVRVLVHFCGRSALTREAEAILEAFLRKAEFSAPHDRHTSPTEDPSMLRISILEECLEYPGFQDVYLRQLTHLFSTGALPITWAATGHFDLMWTELFMGITSRSSAESEALLVLLLSTVFRTVLEEDGIGTGTASSKSLHKSFSKLHEIVLRTLLTIVILRFDQTLPSGYDAVGQRVLGAARRVLQQAYVECGIVRTAPQTSSGWILVLSLVLLDCFEAYGATSSIKRDQLTNVFSTLNPHSRDSSSTDLVSVLSSCSAFICSVAHSCGKVDASGALRYLESMLERLSTLAPKGRCTGSTFFLNLVTDCAYLFAEQQPCVRNLAFAESIGLRAVPHSSRIKASASVCAKQSPDQLRWEDGICEWVATTPRLSSSDCTTLETGSGGCHAAKRPAKEMLHRCCCSTNLCSANAGAPHHSSSIIEDDYVDRTHQSSRMTARIGATVSASSCPEVYQACCELSTSPTSIVGMPILVESVLQNKLERPCQGQAEHDNSDDELSFLGSICCYGTARALDDRHTRTRRNTLDHRLASLCHPQTSVLSFSVEDSEDELGV